MEDFNAFRDVPLIGSFLVLLGLLVKQILPWKQLNISAEQQIRTELRDRITELKGLHADVVQRLIDCEKECAEAKTEFSQKITGLQKQHLAEQIALVRTIVDLFPTAPQLQLLLKALETGKRSIEYLGEVAGDKEGEAHERE